MPNDAQVSGEPNLDSFVLRFVRNGETASATSLSGASPERTAARPANWHGVIRHVQSNRERVFNRWADAVAFIGEFVDVHAQSFREQDVHEQDAQEQDAQEHEND